MFHVEQGEEDVAANTPPTLPGGEEKAGLTAEKDEEDIDIGG